MFGGRNRTPSNERKIPVQFIRGFPFPVLPGYLKRNIESAISLSPKDDEVIISTYPTAIDSWMVALIFKILSLTLPSTSESFIHPIVYDLERQGTSILETSSLPRLLRMHTPYHLTPRNSKAKYIYMIRNPKGIVLSYYLYYNTVPVNGFRGSFSDFFDSFVAGELPYGDYSDHVRSWNAHRNDSNVLVLSYERMHANPRTQILNLARFFGPQCFYHLDQNPESVENILDYPFKMHDMNYVQNVNQGGSPSIPLQSLYPYWYGDGILGAWSKYMTSRQELLLDQIIARNIGGVEDQWKVWEV